MKRTRTCSVCGETKPFEAFVLNKKSKYGRTSPCKTCKNKREKERARKNPGYFREWNLKRDYGITLDDYNKLLESQDGVCAICGNINRDGEPLSVDHDHDTGEIRGLLCSHCNSVIGFARDNPVTLRKAADYLDGG